MLAEHIAFEWASFVLVAVARLSIVCFVYHFVFLPGYRNTLLYGISHHITFSMRCKNIVAAQWRLSILVKCCLCLATYCIVYQPIYIGMCGCAYLWYSLFRVMRLWEFRFQRWYLSLSLSIYLFAYHTLWRRRTREWEKVILCNTRSHGNTDTHKTHSRLLNLLSTFCVLVWMRVCPKVNWIVSYGTDSTKYT